MSSSFFLFLIFFLKSLWELVAQMCSIIIDSINRGSLEIADFGYLVSCIELGVVSDQVSPRCAISLIYAWSSIYRR